jgi:hypothetical protein
MISGVANGPTVFRTCNFSSFSNSIDSLMPFLRTQYATIPCLVENKSPSNLNHHLLPSTPPLLAAGHCHSLPSTATRTISRHSRHQPPLAPSAATRAISRHLRHQPPLAPSAATIHCYSPPSHHTLTCHHLPPIRQTKHTLLFHGGNQPQQPRHMHDASLVLPLTLLYLCDALKRSFHLKAYLECVKKEAKS